MNGTSRTVKSVRSEWVEAQMNYMRKNSSLSAWSARVRKALPLIAFVISACAHHGNEAKTTYEVRTTACELNQIEGAFDCGQVDVFEDVKTQTGTKITINYLVARATGKKNDEIAEPLFFITGGPGLSSIDAAARVVAANGGVRQTRDIVFLEQRGVGRSNPLNCSPADPEANTLSVDDHKRCFEELSADVNLQFYTTTSAAHDIELVRKALGYGQINLYGVSYGTILSQEYIRRYESSVRSATLLSSYPPGESLLATMPIDGQRALDALISDCAKSVDCDKAFPKLVIKVTEMFDRLEARQRGQHDKDASHKQAAPAPDYSAITQAVYLSLYETQYAAGLPLALWRAATEGDYSGVFGVFEWFGSRTGGSFAMGLSNNIFCNEGMPYVDIEDASAGSAGTFLKNTRLERNIEICAEWGRFDIPADFTSPVRSSVPVLLVTGGLDPITSPERGQAVAEGFSNSRFVVINKMSHLAGPVWEQCLHGIFEAFIESADPESLDASCASRGCAPGVQIAVVNNK